MDQGQLGGLLTIMMIGSVVGHFSPDRSRTAWDGSQFCCWMLASRVCALADCSLSAHTPGPHRRAGVDRGGGLLRGTGDADRARRGGGQDLARDALRDVLYHWRLMGAPWALLLGTLVDKYGFPVAFAVMGASQVAAGLCILPVRLRHTRATVPVP